MPPWRKCETGPSAMSLIIFAIGIVQARSITAHTSIRMITPQAGSTSAICPKDLSEAVFTIPPNVAGRPTVWTPRRAIGHRLRMQRSRVISGSGSRRRGRPTPRRIIDPAGKGSRSGARSRRAMGRTPVRLSIIKVAGKTPRLVEGNRIATAMNGGCKRMRRRSRIQGCML